MEPVEIVILDLYSPTEYGYSGSPRLTLQSPYGSTFDYDLGMGLEYLHAESGLVARIVIDKTGVWKYQWHGFDAPGPLIGTLIADALTAEGVH